MPTLRPGTLLHIAESDSWDTAERTGEYRAASLASEGFIHCSSPAQVVATAQRYYAGHCGLVLLEIDADSLPLRWERSTNDELFPHVYGPIPIATIVAVHRFEPDGGGTFSVP